MGLRSDIQTDVGAAFNTDLYDATKQFIISYTENDYYDANNNNLIHGGLVSAESRGVFDNYLKEIITDSGIYPITTAIIVLANEISIYPEINFHINQNGNEYNIVKVESDPADATFTLYCIGC